MDNTTILIIAAVVILIGGLFIYGRITKKRRREAFRQLGDKLMFNFSENNDDIQLRATPFYLGARGRAHAVANALAGNHDGNDIVLFDHYFKTGYGRSTQHHYSTPIEFNSSRLDLPFFTLRKKGFLSGLSNAFGKEKAMKIEASEAFNKQYKVIARDPGDEMAIQSMLTPDRQAFFATHSDFNIEGRGSTLFVYRERKQLKIDDVDQFMRDSRDIFNQFASASTWD